MVDRVAKAMCAPQAHYMGIEVDTIVLSEDDEKVPYYTMFLTLARLAIEAMREPTEAMMSKFNGYAQCEGFVEEGWSAMIDEALESQSAHSSDTR